MALTCLEDSISWVGKIGGLEFCFRGDLETQERINTVKRRFKRKKIDFLEIILPLFKKKPVRKESSGWLSIKT
jgi:hypothetical protein